jgi:hypothetical protein
MSSPKAALQARAVPQQCKLLRLPAVGSQCAGIAELAVKEKQSHLDYLEAWLAAELEERERNPVARRLRDAHLPRMKTLEALDFSPSPKISAAEIRQRAATAPSAGALVSLGADRHRRGGVRAPRRPGSGVSFPGDRREGRKGGGDHDDQPALLGVDAGDSERAAL